MSPSFGADVLCLLWNHPKIVGITYWGYLVGSTWRANTGLLNTNGTERPALTWLVDFLSKNKNPPNDFPDLLSGITGTISQDAPFTPIPQGPLTRNDLGFVKTFDLQGRMTGSFYINNPTIPVWSMVPSSGSFVVKRDGRGAGLLVIADPSAPPSPQHSVFSLWCGISSIIRPCRLHRSRTA